MISLLIFTERTDIMGQFANSRLAHLAALLWTALVLMLNIFLIVQTLGVVIPNVSSGRQSCRAAPALHSGAMISAILQSAANDKELRCVRR